MKNIAVFASGSGSNFQAIVDAVKSNTLQVNIALLVCDKENAYVIERANKEGIKKFIFTAKNYENKAAYESAILQELTAQNVDYIILAGYMRLIGETLLHAYEKRIVNVHPSLLPQFPGKDAIGQAIEAGVAKSGITIHYVDEGMDTGPIIAQQEIVLAEDETKESLQTKIHALEHELYPKVIQTLVN